VYRETRKISEEDRFVETCCLALSDSSVQFFIVQFFCSLVVFFNFLGVHVLYVLCFYVVIVILYVLLCCHLRQNKDTHYSARGTGTEYCDESAVPACTFVCMSASISPELLVQSSPHFMHVQHVVPGRDGIPAEDGHSSKY